MQSHMSLQNEMKSRRSLVFDYIHSHTVTIKPGTTSITLFQDDAPYSSERIPNLKEEEIVSFILADQGKRQLFLSKITSQPGLFFEALPDRELPNGVASTGGDIDLLIIENGDPSRAIAIEFKKVKIRVDSEGEQRVNNLGGLSKLINQGNQRRSQGFYKSFICAIAVIDSAEFKTPNVIVKRTNSEPTERLYNLDSAEGIHPDVGIILIEVPQPTGASYRTLSGFGVCLLRLGTPQDQPSRITNDIYSLLRKRANL